MAKFKVGDKVLRIGTNFPIMIIKGRTAKAGLPSYTIKDSFWTCYWENNGPHWEEIEESQLTQQTE
jgi:hypothetical protein